MTDVVVVETTFATAEEAKKIASAIVEKRFGACCQIISSIHSVYRWKGKVEEAQEVLLRIKTLRREVADLLSFLEKNHSYDVPELLLYSSESLSQSYFHFIDTSVGNPT
jgi:periplasmic divalent cation tolerance protein